MTSVPINYSSSFILASFRIGHCLRQKWIHLPYKIRYRRSYSLWKYPTSWWQCLSSGKMFYIFLTLNFNCFDVFDLRNFQVIKNCSDLPQFKSIVLDFSDLKKFTNSWPSASNFKRFSLSLEYFFLTEGQDNFGNKIQFLLCIHYLNWTYISFIFFNVSGQTFGRFRNPSSHRRQQQRHCDPKTNNLNRIFSYRIFVNA